MGFWGEGKSPLGQSCACARVCVCDNSGAEYLQMVCPFPGAAGALEAGAGPGANVVEAVFWADPDPIRAPTIATPPK